MLPGSLENEELLSRLRAEVNAARERFDSAKTEYDVNTAEARGLGLETADGTHLLRSTAQRYNFAAKAYGDALRRFARALHDLRLIE
ncbi:MAG: hypothetical protein ACLP59_16990 [Bryobacteraceae bacterium]